MHPILQFGTSRFLQAHVDLFISEALEEGQALGRVTVVQTTGSAASARRVAAFRQGGAYPVVIRGWQDGAMIQRELQVASVANALQASQEWPAVVEAAVAAQVIVSNTGDRGYELDSADGAHMLESGLAPQSFPAKLLVLLHARFLRGAARITLMPCELLANNGDALREVVGGLARSWKMDAAFLAWLEGSCVWVNSLVDRIVSQAIEPAGAVAEPYALWAIEAQPGMVLPCTHPHIVVTDRLAPFERRKLLMLNLGHTFLAERWLRDARPAGETVREAMADPALRAELEAVWAEEVLPLFAALGEEVESCAYVAQVRDRFCNPFLEHRLADIAQNHEEKKRRRLQPALELAAELGLRLPQTRLRAAFGREVAA
ncbi:mannitol dehydrogenase family protein [Pseudoduganella eburnea]|uniref:Mannitol dehydrogenase family protein n=1 Tax=Massilia eburnea TaxID=1776165 RepID=A0A6L6QCS5_9BURK|nr:mannitol dehydrogenase family protein [Massilia eburnea]MTW09965.1 mannitol dehydrogenase family protein [Massilia eburnea]